MYVLTTLGELRLTGPAGEVLPGRRKELALLAYLARLSPQAVPRARLAALLWGEREEARARQSLRQALLQLKRAVGEGVRVGRESVVLVADVLALDVAAFEADVAAGRWRDAVARWRGDFLVGLEDLGGEAYRDWLEAERERLRQRLGWGLEHLVAEAERAGRWHEAARWADRWTAERPHDERAHLRLVEALRMSHRAGEALARHVALLARLQRDEVEPSAELLQLGEKLEHDARAELARAPSPGSAALFTPDLTGRDAPLGELTAAWQAAAAGFATVVLVEGEEGIGKTRLCEEFLRRLGGEEGPACLLRTAAVEGGAEWAAARELLAPLRAARGLSGVPDRALSQLQRLVPSIGERFPTLPRPDEGAGMLAAGVARALADVSMEGPVVAFLDDLPWADAASQQLIASLAKALSGNVMLLLTARSGVPREGSALAELAQVPTLRRLRLQPLDADETDALVGSMLELAAAERRTLSQRVHAESGGNPFFATALLAALVDEDYLAPDAEGAWRLSPALAGRLLPLPSSTRDAVRRRLERLTAPAQQLLRAAVSLPATAGTGGGHLDPDRLAAAARLPPPLFSDALDELIARRLLRPAPHPACGYTFVHEAIRRVAGDVLPLHDAGPAESAETPAPARPKADPRHRRRTWTGRGLAAALAVAVVVILIPMVATFSQPGSREPPAAPVLAVGLIRDFTGSDTAGVSRALPEMLATNLARLPNLQVVSNARIHEILARSGRGSSPSPLEAVARAARQAGATEILEGSLHRDRSGALRLYLQRLDLASGIASEAYVVEAPDAFSLVDAMTEKLAARIGEVSAPRLADVTTSSLVAFRFYSEGVQAYYQGDAHAAQRFLAAALEEDSTFAMAAYYLALSGEAAGQPGMNRVLARAARLAERASDRERLLIRAAWADATELRSALAVAETLAIRYPMEPAGHQHYGRALLWRGDFLAAVPHLRRVVAMDSLGLSGAAPRCLACDALADLVLAYTWADSLPAAERTAREWVRLQAGSARAWNALAAVLEYGDRYDEALAARRRAAPLQPADRLVPLRPALIAIRAGDFQVADQALRQHIRDGTPDVRVEALWFLTISLRYQGRLREALETSRRFRALLDTVPDAPAPPYETVLQAQVLFELGRHHEAAALFDSIAVGFADLSLERQGRNRRAWVLTHAATARAAAGDTTGLARLAATLHAMGQATAHARDQRLHHHLRGLLFAARGDHQAAAAAYRAAVFSLTGSGFTRTNLELGRALLALNRPAEAVAVLRPAFRGPLEASSLYLSRTELHELLGRAHEAAGDRDSAAVHYRRVLHAWRGADPLLHERRHRIESRLRALDP